MAKKKNKKGQKQIKKNTLDLSKLIFRHLISKNWRKEHAFFTILTRLFFCIILK